MSTEVRRSWIEVNPELSIARQCELADVSRATYYREPAKESEENLEIMSEIDQLYTKHPFYGSRKIAVILSQNGKKINRKRIQRLMRVMGLQAIHQKPNTSNHDSGHSKYPYLLRNISAERCNHIWSTDITYIRLSHGFIYLTAVIDWFSRVVLSWEVSNTLDSSFCISCLESALRLDKPEIFNTDQGVQYTGNEFLKVLKDSDIRISMDGKGRWADNIFVERLWRTVKYEEVYLNDYQSVSEAVQGLTKYFIFYNTQRPHQALGYKTPLDFYVENSGCRKLVSHLSN